jgi:hypothetical protein
MEVVYENGKKREGDLLKEMEELRKSQTREKEELNGRCETECAI